MSGLRRRSLVLLGGGGGGGGKGTAYTLATSAMSNE